MFVWFRKPSDVRTYSFPLAKHAPNAGIVVSTGECCGEAIRSYKPLAVCMPASFDLKAWGEAPVVESQFLVLNSWWRETQRLSKHAKHTEYKLSHYGGSTWGLKLDGVMSIKVGYYSLGQMKAAAPGPVQPWIRQLVDCRRDKMSRKGRRNGVRHIHRIGAITV